MNEDKSARYQRLKRRTGVISFIWVVTMLVGLLATGLSISLRSLADAWASFAPGALTSWVSLVFYVVGLALITDIGGLPFAFYSGYVLERRYGLSNERITGWLKDQAKSFAVSVVLGSGAATLIYV